MHMIDASFGAHSFFCSSFLVQIKQDVWIRREVSWGERASL
jgi:hypothetical protein